MQTQECVDFCPPNLICSGECIYKYNFEIEINEEEGSDTKNIEISEEEKKVQETKKQNKIIENLEKGFTSEKYDTTNVNNGKDDVIETKTMTITLTTTENQKNQSSENINTTTIDLGECENLLRKAYNISDEQKLYMKKIDVIQEGLKIPYIKYDVYSKLTGNNLIKLNLTACKNSKVDVSIPLTTTESKEKLDANSDYYNDICYVSSSDSGTDIILKDRKEEFIKGNKTVCQNGCDYKDYDYKNKKVQCSCDVKESSDNFADMKIDKDKTFKNFIDIKNVANINILKCYKALFSKKGFRHNIGSLTIIPIFIFHIICIFIFYKTQLDKIKDKINDIIFGIKNWKLYINSKRKKSQNKKLETNKNILTLNLPKKTNFVLGENIPNKEGNSNPPIKKINNRSIVFNNFININEHNNNIITQNTGTKIKIVDNIDIIQKTKEIMKYNERELNELNYRMALRYDKRSYCQYYFSLIRTKHSLIFSFCYNNDYNSKIIKIDLFFVSFVMNYTVNALFFNDDTMHKIYEDKGKFQFLYQLPQILYSTIISSVINSLLQLLALSEEGILQFKRNKTVNNVIERKIELLNRLKIKFILFFIISTIFLLIFWYYLSMFCAIYQNTQIHLIKDTLISFAMSLLSPFGIYILPGILRIPALSDRKKGSIKSFSRKLLYNLSKLLQFF